MEQFDSIDALSEEIYNLSREIATYGYNLKRSARLPAHVVDDMRANLRSYLTKLENALNMLAIGQREFAEEQLAFVRNEFTFSPALRRAEVKRARSRAQEISLMKNQM